MALAEAFRMPLANHCAENGLSNATTSEKPGEIGRALARTIGIGQAPPPLRSKASPDSRKATDRKKPGEIGRALARTIGIGQAPPPLRSKASPDSRKATAPSKSSGRSEERRGGK